MTRWADLISEALTRGPLGRLVFAVAYGSGVSDRDVLMVYDPPPLTAEILVAGLDALLLGKDALSRLVAMLDPVATEPLLSGRLLYGDADALAEFRAHVAQATPSRGAVRTLMRRSFSSYEASLASLARASGSGSRRFIRLTCCNLGWSISYFAFAMAYRTSPCAMRLADVVERMPCRWRRLWDELTALKPDGEPHKCEALLQRWEDVLLGPVESG